MTDLNAIQQEIVNASMSALMDASIYDQILNHILNKHDLELRFVGTSATRADIVSQRIPSAIEDLGVAEELVTLIKGFGLSGKLAKLAKEKEILTKKQEALSDQLVALSRDLVSLQISAFGHDKFKIEYPRKNTQKPPKELEIVENESGPLKSPRAAEVKTWRTVQPSELIAGLRATVGQQVLARLRDDTWHVGNVCQVVHREEPLSLIDMNQHVNTGGNNIFNERPLLTAEPKIDSPIRYQVAVDIVPNQLYREIVETNKLALFCSAESLLQRYPVGARAVARYRDDNGGTAYYSGLIAEPPGEKNSYRYLIFFDDGYAYYAQPTCIFRIFAQTKENWKQFAPSSQVFIKKYLAQYPQRPLVKMRVGQTVQAELNGNMLPATVVQVDASLSLLQFPDNHVEWVYRGSPRFSTLSVRLGLTPGERASNAQSVEVDYGTVEASMTGDGASASRKVRKSTAVRASKKVVPAITTGDPPPDTMRSSKSTVSTDTTGLHTSVRDSLESGRIVPYLDDLIKTLAIRSCVDHKCESRCLKTLNVPDDPLSGYRSENPPDYKGLNPLEIPIRAGWLRIYIKAAPRAERRDGIGYITPCGRQIRCFSELDHYLHRTDSQLTTDLFCFDKDIIINQEYQCEKSFIKISDLSYGKENVPVSCVNSVDNEAPGFIDYVARRQPVGNVTINEDTDFLVCCDCTDNCRDRSKCACQQLTLEASAFASSRGIVDFAVGYRHRRISNFSVGGIYECNPRCKCDRRCQNRVVQQGIWARVQVFKTNKKGWGIRALNAIPKGSFICTYVGAMYDELTAVNEGNDFGDEYQADLDYIETVERSKEGYEPFAIPPDYDSDFEAASVASSTQRSAASKNTAANTSNISRKSRRGGGRGGRRTTTTVGAPASHLHRASSSSASSITSFTASSSACNTPADPKIVDALAVPAGRVVFSVGEPVEPAGADTPTQESNAASETPPRDNATSPLPTEITEKPKESVEEILPSKTLLLAGTLSPEMELLKKQKDEAVDVDVINVDELNGEVINLADTSESRTPVDVVEIIESKKVDCIVLNQLQHESTPMRNDDMFDLDTLGSIQTVVSQSPTESTLESTQEIDIDNDDDNSSDTLVSINSEKSSLGVSNVTKIQNSSSEEGVAGDDPMELTPTIDAAGCALETPTANLALNEDSAQPDLSHGAAVCREPSGTRHNDYDPADDNEIVGKSMEVVEEIGRSQCKVNTNSTPPVFDVDIDVEVNEPPESTLDIARPNAPLVVQGLSAYEGISNIFEILQNASFNRLPFVRLEKMKDLSKRLPLRRSRRSTRGNITGREYDDSEWLTMPRRSSSATQGHQGQRQVEEATTSNQPHRVLLANVWKTTSQALIRSSSLSNLAPPTPPPSSANNATCSSAGSGQKRSSSTSDLQKMEKQQSKRYSRKDTVTTSSVATAPQPPPPPPPVPWANRRFYPIGNKDWLMARDYFGEASPVVMDAKKMGNLGRYFNHSCEPNVAVQNVFINSHDPRFPEVAFFATRNIAAGEEMTWDYGYVVGAVPRKVLYCYCGEPSCRIRLL